MAKGVTIVEILVVIFIIAIASLLAYPTFNRLKMEANRADARSAVTAVHGMVTRYLAENNKANLDASDLTSGGQFVNYASGSSTPQVSKHELYLITITRDSSGFSTIATAIGNYDGSSTTACSSLNAKQCLDTLCREISIVYGEKKSRNSAGTEVGSATTQCWN